MWSSSARICTASSPAFLAPEIIKLDLDDETVFRSQIVKIKRVLNLGGVMAFPTDTFYGLGATAFNKKAVSRIFKIKQRPKDKPLLTLVASAYQDFYPALFRFFDIISGSRRGPVRGCHNYFMFHIELFQNVAGLFHDGEI